MPMPFINFIGDSIQFRRHGSRMSENCLAAAETHRASHVRFGDLGHVYDNFRRCILIEFGTVRVLQTEYIPCEFDCGYLQSQANSEERLFVLSGILDRQNFSFDTPYAKTSWNKNTISFLKSCPGLFMKLLRRLLFLLRSGCRRRPILKLYRLFLWLQKVFSIDPKDFQSPLGSNSRVLQRFDDREI